MGGVLGSPAQAQPMLASKVVVPELFRLDQREGGTETSI